MAEIEWRVWREVSNECLLIAERRLWGEERFLHVVEAVEVGGLTTTVKVHEVEYRDQKVVRPSIADDADVYLIELLSAEVVPWPMPVSQADLDRRAEMQAERDFEIAEAFLLSAQASLAEAHKDFEGAAEKLRRMKAGK